MQGKQNSYQSIWSEGLVIRSKSLAFSKMSHKTEKFSKLVCGKSFGSFCIRYEIVSSKDAYLEAGSGQKSRFEKKILLLTVKVWTIVKWMKKTKLKICRKWFRVHIFELFSADNRSFEVKKLFPKKTSPWQSRRNSYESIRTEGSAIRSKSLIYSKMSHKTENLSKMVRGVLFGIFCRRFHIIPTKNTFP